MKKLSMIVSLALAVGSCGSTAVADTKKGITGATVSLNEVIAATAQSHPDIREALSTYRSVLAERSIASSGYWPTIGTELSGGPESTNGVGTDERQEDLMSFSATLYARQNLFAGGETRAFVKETDARIQAAAYEVLNVANTVFLSIAESYISVLQARTLLAFAEENVHAQESILEQVREKTASGFNRVSDLYNAESRLALSRANYISKQQDLNQAVVSFHRQFGRFLAPGAFVLPTPAFDLPETVERAVDLALERHPALNVAEYNIQVRKHTLERAKAAYWPTLDLELQTQHSNDTGGTEGETDRSSAQLRMNYTFFDGGAREGEKGRSYGEVRKEYQRAYIERRNVNQAVRLAWNIYKAEQHKQAFLAEHVELGAKTLEAFKEEYFVGRRTLLDLLNMENEFHSAKDAAARSSHALLIAYYRLCQATGILLQEYDAGLRGVLALAPEDDFSLEGLEGLDDNRDADTVADRRDQCDNSATGEAVSASGCEEALEATSYGYQPPETPVPYILPGQETLPEPESLEEEPASSFQLNSIHFESDSARITADSRKVLEEIAARLKAAPDTQVKIIGHTDDTGGAEHNLRLSRERARSVADALIENGIRADRLTAVGRGESEPIATNATEEGKRTNRRIEFRLSEPTPMDERVSPNVGGAAATDTLPTGPLDIAADPLRQSFHLEALTFASDTSDLTDEGLALLEDIAAQLQHLEGYAIEVVGHTDNTGGTDHNQALSRNRAYSVYQFLINSGIPEQKLTYYGMGEREPIATNDSEAGKSRNRRIQFKLIQQRSI
jgi:adhesin transport system outer membrane protein